MPNGWLSVETFLYNWCWWLRNFADITLLYVSSDPLRLAKMRSLVKCEQYEEGKEYECDIFIRNSVWGTIPKGIKAKEKRYIENTHANYKFLLDKGKLYQQWHKMDEINEIVGCGEFVSEMRKLVMGDNPKTIKNILLPNKTTNKVIHLISCTRLDPEKGWNRMLKLADMLRKANIKFEWNIFTNSKEYKSTYEEIHIWKQRYDIWDYLVDADYSVLLSDSEGLPYTIQESLQYKVPCIVTDVGGCTELIKDGVNGYVVPLDMNFDVKKILNIPKCEEYDNKALETWLDYLNIKVSKEDIEKASQRKEEEIMKYKVKALGTYKYLHKKDAELGYEPEPGFEWEISKERLDVLLGNNEYKEAFVEVVEEIADKVEKEEKPKKKATKK